MAFYNYQGVNYNLDDADQRLMLTLRLIDSYKNLGMEENQAGKLAQLEILSRRTQLLPGEEKRYAELLEIKAELEKQK